MRFRGDLMCMVCGRFLGRVTGSKGANGVRLDSFMPGPAFEPGADGGAPKRCDKCGGHLYLDEIEALNGGEPPRVAA
ncbi:MAG: hypothetical protein KGJ86_08655 [Chloroflexota bacterium]|nr:hypothetical protein [Chloroflexota bacterium]